MSDVPRAAERGARAAVLAALALLTVVLVVWHVDRFSVATAAIALALLLIPWAFVAVGLWRRRRRSYRSAVLLLVPYLAYAIMERMANPGARGYATLAVLACLALFVAAGAYLRVSRSR